ncbi:UNVERIFIED_CONTAM: hypothetical protein Sindi_2457900 [Sesamum indicum]
MVALSSMLEEMNASPYDCQSLRDERLRGHFKLAPVTEHLGDSENIMFSKLMREHVMGGYFKGTPSPKSSKGAPTSRTQKINAPLPPSPLVPWQEAPKKILISTL